MSEKKHDIPRLNSLPIIEVANKLGVQIGRGNKTLCFMHTEKSASLSFNIQTNKWRCFGCGKSGGAIDLVKEYLNLDFVGACSWLENAMLCSSNQKYVKRNTTMQKPYSRRELPDERNVDSRLYEEILETLALTATDKDYLCIDRALSNEVVLNSGVRSIENIEAFYKTIRGKYETDRLLNAGMLKISDSGKEKNSWWKSGIIFPYRSFEGRIVNLQLRPHKPFPLNVKYILLSGIKTALYNASALNEYDTGDAVYLCEGAIDTLSLLSKGFKAVGLPGVGSFNEDWFYLLGRFNVILLFDNDDAGVSQSIALQKRFADNGLTARILHLPDKYNDVNDILVAERSGGLQI